MKVPKLPTMCAGCEQLRLCHWAVPLPGASAAGARQLVQLPPLPPHQVLLLQEHLLRFRPVLLPVLQRLQWAGLSGRHQRSSLQCGLHQPAHPPICGPGPASHQLHLPHTVPSGGSHAHLALLFGLRSAQVLLLKCVVASRSMAAWLVCIVCAGIVHHSSQA